MNLGDASSVWLARTIDRLCHVERSETSLCSGWPTAAEGFFVTTFLRMTMTNNDNG
jgi:hypothetical protein